MLVPLNHRTMGRAQWRDAAGRGYRAWTFEEVDAEAGGAWDGGFSVDADVAAGRLLFHVRTPKSVRDLEEGGGGDGGGGGELVRGAEVVLVPASFGAMRAAMEAAISTFGRDRDRGAGKMTEADARRAFLPVVPFAQLRFRVETVYAIRDAETERELFGKGGMVVGAGSSRPPAVSAVSANVSIAALQMLGANWADVAIVLGPDWLPHLVARLGPGFGEMEREREKEKEKAPA